jgi:hypothetical protein
MFSVYFIAGKLCLNKTHCRRGFDSDKYERLFIAYFPDTENGKLFKKELTSAFKSGYYKFPEEKDEQGILLKTEKKYDSDVLTDEAQELGRLLKAKAVILVKRIDFSGDGKVLYAGIEIVDPYGGVLVSIVHRGGKNPETIRSAAWSILNGIGLEDMKYERIREHDHESKLIPVQ